MIKFIKGLLVTFSIFGVFVFGLVFWFVQSIDDQPEYTEIGSTGYFVDQDAKLLFDKNPEINGGSSVIEIDSFYYYKNDIYISRDSGFYIVNIINDTILQIDKSIIPQGNWTGYR